MQLLTFLRQLLSYLLLAEAALAQNTLAQTCTGLENLSTCKFEFSVPYGVNVTTKEVPDRKYNKCKSKKEYKKACPTPKQPKRMCDAWKCVAGGWDNTTKRVPTGLKVLTKHVNLCDTVRRILGQPQGDKFIQSSEAICRCFPRIDQLSATAALKSFSEGVISQNNTKVIDQLLTVEKCMVDGGFRSDDNRDKVRKSLQAKAKRNSLIIEGPEISEDSYAQLMAVMKECQQGSCDGTQIEETIRYITILVLPDIAMQYRQGVFFPWETLLENMQLISTDLNNAAVKLESSSVDFQAQFDSIKSTCDELGSCNGPAVSAFVKQVSDLLDATKRVSKIRAPAKVVDENQNLLIRVADADRRADELLDANASVALFKEVQVETVQDIFKFFPTIQRAISLSNDMLEVLSTFVDYSSYWRGFVGSTFETLVKLSEQSSAAMEKELSVKGRDDKHKLIQKINMIKEFMKRDVHEHLFYVNQALERYQDQVAKSSFAAKRNGISMETNVVSYQRWVKIPKMAMPCSKQTSKTYNKAGFSKTFPYTEYFKCMVGSATAYYPNLQIPYILLTL